MHQNHSQARASSKEPQAKEDVISSEQRKEESINDEAEHEHMKLLVEQLVMHMSSGVLGATVEPRRETNRKQRERKSKNRRDIHNSNATHFQLQVSTQLGAPPRIYSDRASTHGLSKEEKEMQKIMDVMGFKQLKINRRRVFHKIYRS